MVFTSGNIEFSQTNPEKSFNLFICCFWKSHSRHLFVQNPQPNYYNNMWNLFKVSDRDARKTSWCRVFMFNFEHISYLFQVIMDNNEVALLSLLLTLNILLTLKNKCLLRMHYLMFLHHHWNSFSFAAFIYTISLKSNIFKSSIYRENSN